MYLIHCFTRLNLNIFWVQCGNFQYNANSYNKNCWGISWYEAKYVLGKCGHSPALDKVLRARLANKGRHNKVCEDKVEGYQDVTGKDQSRPDYYHVVPDILGILANYQAGVIPPNEIEDTFCSPVWSFFVAYLRLEPGQAAKGAPTDDWVAGFFGNTPWSQLLADAVALVKGNCPSWRFPKGV